VIVCKESKQYVSQLSIYNRDWGFGRQELGLGRTAFARGGMAGGSGVFRRFCLIMKNVTVTWEVTVTWNLAQEAGEEWIGKRACAYYRWWWIRGR